MAAGKSAMKPLWQYDSDDEDTGRVTPIVRRKPMTPTVGRIAEVYSPIDDVLDSHIIRRPQRKTVMKPTVISVPLDDDEEYYESPPVRRRPLAMRRFKEPINVLSRNQGLYRWVDGEQPLGYPDPEILREVLSWERRFDPQPPILYSVIDPELRNNTEERRAHNRAPVVQLIDPTTEDYDDALFQRARLARAVGQPSTKVRPWRQRVPKFEPQYDFRPPQVAPPVRRYKGRPLRVDEQVLINYHVSRGKVPPKEGRIRT